MRRFELWGRGFRVGEGVLWSDGWVTVAPILNNYVTLKRFEEEENYGYEIRWLDPEPATEE